MADDKQNYTKTGIDQSHDIVTRLRQYVLWLPNTAAGEVCREAADEIERLRAAGDALADALRSGSDSGWDAAIDAWEARRG